MITKMANNFHNSICLGMCNSILQMYAYSICKRGLGVPHKKGLCKMLRTKALLAIVKSLAQIHFPLRCNERDSYIHKVINAPCAMFASHHFLQMVSLISLPLLKNSLIIRVVASSFRSTGSHSLLRYTISEYAPPFGVLSSILSLIM